MNKIFLGTYVSKYLESSLGNSATWKFHEQFSCGTLTVQVAFLNGRKFLGTFLENKKIPLKDFLKTKNDIIDTLKTEGIDISQGEFVIFSQTFI